MREAGVPRVFGFVRAFEGGWLSFVSSEAKTLLPGLRRGRSVRKRSSVIAEDHRRALHRQFDVN
jgi:hypothetical protein